MTATTPTTAPVIVAAGDQRRRIFAIVAASSGNLVEWFDFYVYAFMAVYFAPAFFPGADPTVQLLDAAGIFAAGFLVRPIGGWLFGRIADRHGRRLALVASVLLMGGGSLVIALLPTYASIGVLAPALLLVARLLQGLSVGGEYGTTATYMSEVAIRGQRGLLASFQYTTLIGGQLLAVLVLVTLQRVFDDAELRAWAWRIPFGIGAITALLALWLRSGLHETAPRIDRGNREAGSLGVLLREHKAAFLTVLGYTAGGSLAFYTFTTYMHKYLVNTAGMPIRTASNVMTACLFVFLCVQPAFGALSDRIGRRRNMLLFATLGALATVPLLSVLGRVTSPLAAFGLICIALGIISFYTSIAGLVKAEMFPVEVRALGVGFAYAIANAIFGGSAEYVALGLKSTGHESAFPWYVSAMLVVALFASLRVPREPRYLGGDA